MKSLVTIAAAVGVLCACSTPAPEARPPAPDREVSYTCVNGPSLTVLYLPARNLAVLRRDGSAIELPQQISGSGFIYSNGPNTIRGKGDELTVEIGRMVPMHCKAQ